MVRLIRSAAPAFLTLLLAAAPAAAADTFRIRLTPVPIEAAIRADVTGRGEATAVLDGTRLTITGSFEGLGGPATIARLDAGPVMAGRGPAVADLPVPAATAGEFRAEVELAAAQLEALASRRVYLQIASERAPDGNLWGWLLP